MYTVCKTSQKFQIEQWQMVSFGTVHTSLQFLNSPVKYCTLQYYNIFFIFYFFLGGANWAYIFLITIHAHFLLFTYNIFMRLSNKNCKKKIKKDSIHFLKPKYHNNTLKVDSYSVQNDVIQILRTFAQFYLRIF